MLFGRVRESLEQERRFTANAAHELRSPLAALRGELELALRQEEEGVARQFDPEWQSDPARTAERWFWLGEVAQAEQKPVEARRRYERAAAYASTPFGQRAQTSLALLRSQLPAVAPSASSA